MVALTCIINLIYMKLGEFLKEIPRSDINSLEKTFGKRFREEEITPELIASLSETRNELLEWCNGPHAHEEGREKTRNYQ